MARGAIAAALWVAGKPPGLVLMSANFVLDLKLAGDVVSLEPMLKAEGTTRLKFLDDFWPALWANATVDGELYAIPFQNSTPLLYYNKDHFKAAGLDPEKPPQTWAQLVDAAKKLSTAEHTGFGWKNIMTATAADLTLPTICKMKRPE